MLATSDNHEHSLGETMKQAEDGLSEDLKSNHHFCQALL